MPNSLSPSSVADNQKTLRGQPIMEALANKILRVVRVLVAHSPTFTTDGFVGGQKELLDIDDRVSVTTDGAGAATVTFPQAFRGGIIRVVFSTTALAYVRRSSLALTGFTIVGPALATFDVEYNARGY